MKYEILILLGIAVFLIFRLRSVLGTREGFEKPPSQSLKTKKPPDFQVIEGGPDTDIVDHVEPNSPMVAKLLSIKRVDPNFKLTDFLIGARTAYELILMGFERGEINEIRQFLSDEVAETFDSVIKEREAQGINIEAEFAGIREIKLQGVEFETSTNIADLTVNFVGELISAAKNKSGEIVEGDEKQIKRQKDIWTFSKDMSASDPNWRLVATDE